MHILFFKCNSNDFILFELKYLYFGNEILRINNVVLIELFNTKCQNLT